MRRGQPAEGELRRGFTCVVVAVLLGLAASLPGIAQDPTGNASPQVPTGNASPQTPGPPGGLLRKSPPQPQQKQAIDYFVGEWNVTWSGRESAFSLGPRTGTLSYTRMGDSNFLEIRGEGKTEAGAAYKESGIIGWNEAQKTLALHERLTTGVEVLSIGDWTSPITIRFESAPIGPIAGTSSKPVPAVPGKPVRGPTLTLRRIYGIVSAQSFTVTEEQSTDGKTLARLGRGVFGKVTAKE